MINSDATFVMSTNLGRPTSIFPLIGWRCSTRLTKMCVLFAKCTPSQELGNKDYDMRMCIDVNNGDVQNA